MGMESCPPGSTEVAGRGGLQPHLLTSVTMVPPCWVTGPKGLGRAGGLQQVRWGGKERDSKERAGKGQRGGRTAGTETEGTEKDRGGRTTRGKNCKG